MSQPVAITLEHLKTKVLPTLFANPTTIGSYGNTVAMTENIDALSKLMEGGSAGKLAATITEILSKMADASPEKISKPQTWMDRLLGNGLEKHVRYQVARKSFEELLKKAEQHANGVRHTIHSISELIGSHQDEVESLAVHIQAGREFLSENPEAGVAAAGAMEFDRPRERLARKLTNLATLLASHELSVNQMKLSRAQAVDMLDRFSETVTVLVPVWRQHTLTLITTKNMSVAMVEEASKAHQALMASLATSLDGMTQH
ncbi:toxic anion resistance protein [Pseudomonas aeruginosa]